MTLAHLDGSIRDLIDRRACVNPLVGIGTKSSNIKDCSIDARKIASSSIMSTLFNMLFLQDWQRHLELGAVKLRLEGFRGIRPDGFHDTGGEGDGRQ